MICNNKAIELVASRAASGQGLRKQAGALCLQLGFGTAWYDIVLRY